MECKLKSKLAIGQSKQADKKAEHGLLKEKRKETPNAMLSYKVRITIHKIYSWGTFRDYQKHACYFVKWCKECYHCKTIEECRAYVDEWLTERSDPAHMFFRHKKTGKLDFTSSPALFNEARDGIRTNPRTLIYL